MPKLTDTYARAYDCCDAVFTELGRFPTIDLIRERIGVNSPVTIKKAMNEWTRHFAEQHFDKLNRPDVPVALAQAMEQAWKLAVVEAEKAYLQKERGYQQTVADQQAAMDALAQDKAGLAQTLAAVEARLAESEGQVVALRGELEAQAETVRLLSGQRDATEQQLTQQLALAVEQDLRWRQQQEQDQAWFARRILEERQFAEDKLKDKLERQALQVAVLRESEAALQNTGIGLRRELRRLEVALAESQQNIKQPFKFKPNSKTHKKAGQGQGG
ncbi:DNA-binding protein [Methylovulum miyakonense]|uniref:DNA-binding protein n=1 Tax=Methylovulum miyakonense TaxID=645578 RepID=UPI0003A5F9E5|nr:DNA-binding protein [Methylovulum miyakonense]